MEVMSCKELTALFLVMEVASRKAPSASGFNKVSTASGFRLRLPCKSSRRYCISCGRGQETTAVRGSGGYGDMFRLGQSGLFDECESGAAHPDHGARPNHTARPNHAVGAGRPAAQSPGDSLFALGSGSLFDDGTYDFWVDETDETTTCGRETRSMSLGLSAAQERFHEAATSMTALAEQQQQPATIGLKTGRAAMKTGHAANTGFSFGRKGAASNHQMAENDHGKKPPATASAPPVVLFKGSFGDALKAAELQQKWLLVNIHVGADDMDCLWKNEIVQNIIQSVCIFWQEPFGSQATIWYFKTHPLQGFSPTAVLDPRHRSEAASQFRGFSHTALFDPRDGTKVWQCAGLMTPAEFIKKVTDVTDTSSLGTGSTRPPQYDDTKPGGDRKGFDHERMRSFENKTEDFDTEKGMLMSVISCLESENEDLRASVGRLKGMRETSQPSTASAAGLMPVLQECSLCLEHLLSGLGTPSFGVMSYSCDCSKFKPQMFHVSCIMSLASFTCPVCYEEIVVIAPLLREQTLVRNVTVRKA